MNSARVKKSKLTTSTPANNTGEKPRTRIEPLESLSDSFQIPSKQKPHLQPKKSPMIDLICEAINAVGVPRKGASYINIRKWILNNSQSDASDARLIVSMKKAFKIGLEKEVLGRPQKCKNLHGLTGSFVVLKKPSEIEKPKKIMKKSKIDDKPKAKSTLKAASTTIGNPTRRLNLSNTLVKKIKEKPVAAEKKTKNTKVIAIKSPKAGTSKVTAKQNPEVAIQRTRKGVTEALVIKTPNAKLTKFAAKRTPKVVVQKTLKRKSSAVPVKSTSKAKKLVGESKNSVKRTTKDKAILVPKPPKSEPKEKIVKAKDQSKNTKPKELFSLDVKPPSNDVTRKDLSDTELEVKPRGRKSLKSYSSDTDVAAIDLNSIKKQKPSKKLPKK